MKLMKNIRLRYSIPKNLFIYKMQKQSKNVSTKAVISYNFLILCLIKCLKCGKNPNIQSDMYNRQNTLLLLLSLDDNRIDEKNIAFIDVGENTLFYI
jgi:hypothetical protein